MAVVVDSIRFNHTPGSARLSAINVRRNAGAPVTTPEWRRGQTALPEQSPAVYAIGNVDPRALTVRVALRTDDPSLSAVEVRAIEAPRPSLPWWLPYYVHQPELLWGPNPLFARLSDYQAWLSYSAWYRAVQAVANAGPNVLGEVAPTVVSFGPNRRTRTENLPLAGPRLVERGVSVGDVAWRWQYRPAGGGAWRDMGTTLHRVYSVLAVPTAPWTQSPSGPDNTQLPWLEVLDFACDWARGARTAEEAASAVTRRVFALGNGMLQYGCPIGAVTRYSFPHFNCTAFLERLRGGVGNGPYVNCTDCATIVSTFANALGCDLWQSRMGSYDPPFETNPIRVIGSWLWQSPCGTGLGFSYHEVAWSGGCTAEDAIFDACVALDADVNPTSPPIRGEVPANLRFGMPGDGQYRDRMAAPSGRALCVPRPAERKRRLVF